jgi:hypothetical protein
MRQCIHPWAGEEATRHIDGEQGKVAFVSWYPDPGTRPEDTWRWAHVGEKLIGAVNNPDWRVLRKWGYVMWDQQRLIAKGLMDQPWAG